MTSPPPISLRPSDGHWLHGCTAAPAYIAEEGAVREDTVYSIDGKVAHACAEAFIMGKAAPPNTPPEAKAHARVYAKFVEPFKEGATWGVERRVPRFYQPEKEAVIDFYAVAPRRITIIDFKYGVGVAVHASNNKQTAIYARSLIEQLPGTIPDDIVVEMHIRQPRVMDGEKHSTWLTTWGELRQFTDDEVGAVAHNILSGGPTQFLVSDKTCRFCPMKKLGCKAREAEALKGLPELEGIGEGALDLQQVKDVERLGAIVAQAPLVIEWLKDQIDYAQSLALGGTPVPGQKLVLSKGGHRAWSDVKAAAKLLREKFKPTILWKKTLVTPAQTMEALDAMQADAEYVKQVEALMFKPAGQPVLAPVTDKRAEWKPEAALLDELPDLDAETTPDLMDLI